MIEIKPNAIYTLKDLAEHGISARWLTAKVRPRKLDHSSFLGSDLLDALRAYTQERERPPLPAKSSLAAPRKRGRPRKAEIEPLDLSKYEK
jgi:hypothetical protein